MPRGRWVEDDDWSGSDDIDVRFHARRPSRSHSKHGPRASNEGGPTYVTYENKLYVPGDLQGDRRPSRSRSRRRSSSSERERRRRIHTEDLGLDVLAQLQLRDRGRDRSHSHSHSPPHQHRDFEAERREYMRDLERMRRDEEDERRRVERDVRQARMDDEEKKERLERELKRDYDEKSRSARENRERLIRELEDEKRKEEERYNKAIRDAEDKERKEKEKREKLAAEFRAEEERKKQEAKETEARILAKAAADKEKKEKEDKELRERILLEEKEKQLKEKEKERKANEEFEARIRERAIKAGVDPDRMLRQLRDRSPAAHPHSKSTSEIVTYQRNTYRRPIKVRRDHIVPEVLDAYSLRWTYSSANRDIIIIDEEIDDEFLYELQVESDKVLKSRKLITPGYEKHTVTTLKPTSGKESILKKDGHLYLVRKRSRSRSVSRNILSDLV